MPSDARIDSKRERRNPPQLDLAAARTIAGITLDELSQRIEEATERAGRKITASRGTLSAIESGWRGLSAELRDGIALAYGINPSQIAVDYDLRERREPKALAV